MSVGHEVSRAGLLRRRTGSETHMLPPTLVWRVGVWVWRRRGRGEGGSDHPPSPSSLNPQTSLRFWEEEQEWVLNFFTDSVESSAHSYQTHQQFKSSADFSKTENVSQQTHVISTRKYSRKQGHIRDDCKTQGCHAVFRTDRNNVAVLLSDSGHKSSSNQHPPSETENSTKHSVVRATKRALRCDSHTRFDKLIVRSHSGLARQTGSTD